MNMAPEKRHYAAVFAISLSLLVLEIAVARILSVALYSHYAFVAISLAMFGLGLSGLVVYLMPSHFSRERLDEQLVHYSSMFGFAAAASVLVFLKIPIVQELSLQGFITLSLAYGVLTLPFLSGGICISLLMTHFSTHIGRIYFADLVGASLGCMGVVLAMEAMPAPMVPLLVACAVSVSAFGMSWFLGSRHRIAPALILVVVVAMTVSGITTDTFKMRHVKSWSDLYSDSEAWNSFSRVSAFDFEGNAAQVVPLSKPSQAYGSDEYPDTMMLDIDGAAWTPMMNFNGDFSSIEFLKESVLYIAHHLKPLADVLIIGTGGGRDILAAKVFDQASVLGIELNPLMRQVVNERYGDYSGRPYTLDGVDVIIDEARSRLHRIDRRFGIIQLSLIDTFSLNAAGGFVFSENNLYTREAFQLYFQRLTDDGILSLTRYFVAEYPLEVLKIITLARAAWSEEGVDSIADRVIVLRQGLNATVLVKRSALTAQDLDKIEKLAKLYNIGLLYLPGRLGKGHPDVERAVTVPDIDAYVAGHDFIIEAPTDDRPFFFNFLRSRLETVPERRKDPFQFLRLWDDALALMYLLIGVVTAMAVLFFAGPLLFLGRRGVAGVPVGPTVAFLLYFAALGYGFMMIEIPLLQQLILFLGYPVYALAVVLFSLLLFSGIGSLISSQLASPSRNPLLCALVAIMVIAVAYTYIVPAVITAFLASPIAVKIVISVVLLAPIGLVLGMAYPLGIGLLNDMES